MALLILDSVVSSSDGDDSLVKATDKLQDCVFKVYTKILEQTSTPIQKNNKHRPKFHKHQYFLQASFLCVNSTML
jgi:hypothetical protein